MGRPNEVIVKIAKALDAEKIEAEVHIQRLNEAKATALKLNRVAICFY
ncbi:MAG: hypothetical protein ACYDGS_01390 [Thermoleophilia bacterium]